MKRSRSIKLLLLGSLSAGVATTGCGPSREAGVAISTDSVLTNDFYVARAGYYHAPFRAWHRLPYNYFDPNTRLYFYGGEWGIFPHQSITNVSAPTPQAVAAAEPPSRHVAWGGFGGSGRNHSIWS